MTCCAFHGNGWASMLIIFILLAGHLCSYLHAALQDSQRFSVFSSLSRQHLVQLHFHLVQPLPKQPAITRWSQFSSFFPFFFFYPSYSWDYYNIHLTDTEQFQFRLTSLSAPEIVSPDLTSHPGILLSSAHSLHHPSLHRGHRERGRNRQKLSTFIAFL